MKKIFSIFITVLLLLQMQVTAYDPLEEETKELSLSEKIAELKRYGVLDEDFDDSEEALSANITRGEFAKMIAIIMGGKDYVPSGEVLFDDVDTNSEYYPYIEYLAIVGAVATSNTDKRQLKWAYKRSNDTFIIPEMYTVEELLVEDERIYNFYPDRYINIFEVAKLINFALGYTTALFGGYPHGYIVVLDKKAPNLNWRQSYMNYEKQVTWGEAVDLIYETTFCCAINILENYYDSWCTPPPEITLKDIYLKQIQE